MHAGDEGRTARNRESGQASIEHVVIMLIAAAVIGTVAATGGTSRIFSAVSGAICWAMPGDTACADGGTDPGGDDPGGDDPDEPGEEPNPDDVCDLDPPPGQPGGPIDPVDPVVVDHGASDADDLADIVGDTFGLGNTAGWKMENGSPHFNIAPFNNDDQDALYDDLVGFFDDHAANLSDPSYAAGLVNELGPDTVRRLIDLTNTYGLEDSDSDRDLNTTHEEYVQPLADLLSAADRSGQLDPAIRQELIDPGPPSTEEIIDSIDDPSLFDDDVDLDDASVDPELAWILEVKRQRAHAVLLEAGDFSPSTVADLSAGILEGATPKLDAIGATEGYGTPDFFEDGDHTTALGDNRWLVMHMLANDPNAATLFAQDPGNVAMLEAWLDEDNENYDYSAIIPLMAEWRSGMDRDEVVEALQAIAQGALDARCD